MSVFNYPAVLKIFSDFAPSLNENVIYSNMFDSYFAYVGKPEVINKSEVSKIKSGERQLEREGRQYYLEESGRKDLIKDLDKYILKCVSDKHALCDRLCDLIRADSMDDRDRNLLLASYPEDDSGISAFLADVIIFSLNRPTVKGAESPLISERIILSDIKPCKTFSGRKNEFQALYEMLETHSKLFIYGIAGIGKSEFVKKYMSLHKKDYTNILYLTYETNLKSTIAAISFKDDKADDTFEARFTRHSEYLKLLKGDSLIVIDNFDILPHEDDYLETLLTYNCKIVFTTRNHFDGNYDIFELAEMSENEIMGIAAKMKISETADTLCRLFAAVRNNTLACELILKLLTNSAYTGDEILAKLAESNIKPDISDKIRRSGKGSARYNEHIQKLFDLFSLSDEQQDVLRVLSLIPNNGIGDRYFKQLAELSDFNAINELNEIGLIYYRSHTISVHSLISDVAAVELVPDMDNCRIFLDNVIKESLVMVDDTLNRVRRLVLLPIADNVMRCADKSNAEYYVYFLNSLCTYAEVFYDVGHMKKYIAEVDTYIEKGFPPKLHAVHYMSKAALAKIADKDNQAAIRFTLKAAGYIDDSEIFPAINIYNNLFRFYMDADDMENAEKYCAKVKKLANALTYADNSMLIFLFNVKDFYMKTGDYKAAKDTIFTILNIIQSTAPDSEEHIEALMDASKVCRLLGNNKDADVYAMLAGNVAKRRMLTYRE